LHQVENGEKLTEVCRWLGVSEQTFYRWKKQFTGLGLQELRESRCLAPTATAPLTDRTRGSEIDNGR
jgi:transposase-like protein